MKTTATLQNIRRRAGFSLAEVLLVVAILGILTALIVPNVVAARRSLRQKELDAKAEIIYAAAQNQLTKLRAAGEKARYQAGESASLGENMQPYDAKETGEALLLCYVTSRKDTAARAIMADGVVEPELMEQHWIVVYSPLSGSVYAVFYSEDVDVAAEYPDPWQKYGTDLRIRENRVDTYKAQVGYYGGDLTVSLSDTTTLQPYVSVSNDERLAALLHCVVPKDVDVGTLTFRVELRDSAGNRRVVEIDNSPFTAEEQISPEKRRPRLTHPGGRSYSYDLTLDDLSSDATRFDALYGGGSTPPAGQQRLIPGVPLTITLTVSSSNRQLQTGTAVSSPFNSLFDDESTEDTAIVRCGRHLQNLDAASGASANISYAEQAADISFAEDSDWFKAYGARTFQPI